MRKVLHIASGDLWGGAEAVVHALACEQHRVRPGSVACVLMNPGRLADELANASVPITVLDESRQGVVALARAAGAAAHQQESAILHSHRQKEHLVAVLAARLMPGRGPRPPVVASIHGMPEPPMANNRLRRTLVSALQSIVLGHGVDALVGVSMDIASKFQQRYPGRSVICVHNGVSVERAGPKDSRESPAEAVEAPLQLLALGRLVPIKRFDRLLCVADEIERLVAHRPRVTLAGEGPLWNALRTDLGADDIERGVCMPGYCADTTALLNASDALLITSDHEGIPMAVLEALAAGLPVFGFAVGGLPEIAASGASLHLVEPYDCAALASAIVNYFTKHPLRLRLRVPAEWSFDIRQCAAGYARLYDRLLTEQRQRN